MEEIDSFGVIDDLPTGVLAGSLIELPRAMHSTVVWAKYYGGVRRTPHKENHFPVQVPFTIHPDRGGRKGFQHSNLKASQGKRQAQKMSHTAAIVK